MAAHAQASGQLTAIFPPSQYKQAIPELVRCVALTRICYGDCHWKLAEAYVNLAQGYLRLKGERSSVRGGSVRDLLLFPPKWNPRLSARIRLSSSFYRPHGAKSPPFRTSKILYQMYKKEKEHLGPFMILKVEFLGRN